MSQSPISLAKAGQASSYDKAWSALNRLLAGPESGTLLLLPQVERAKRYIEDNYSRRISLSSVAEALHVSPNYLSRIFRVER